ncbi:MAG TPA: hypothetical protein VGH80_03100 [Xanthomonadaceae bacterium]|jgi:hypothetical protein
MLHVALAGVVGCASALAADKPAQDPLDYRHDLARQLQKSDSPRDWALSAQLLDTRPASGANLRERLAILQKAAHAAPDDRMVQGLWADVALDGHCKAKMACGNPSALSRLEPDNGIAWLPAVDRAWRAGNPRVTDAAIARLAQSSRYNEHIGEAIAAWRDVLQRFPPPKPDGANVTAEGGHVLELAFDEAVETAIPSAASLVDACSRAKHPNAGAKRFQDCGRIARVMMGRSQTLVGRSFGVAVLRASHTGTPADVERVRTVTWQAEQAGKFAAAIAADPVARQNYMNLIQSNDSEMPAIHYDLTIFGMALTPPPDWKQTVNGKPVEPLDDVPEQKP